MNISGSGHTCHGSTVHHILEVSHTGLIVFQKSQKLQSNMLQIYLL